VRTFRNTMSNNKKRKTFFACFEGIEE